MERIKKRRRSRPSFGIAAIEMVLILPTMLFVILTIWWLTRVYSTGHTALATSGNLALQEAQKANFSDDFRATESIVRTSAPELSQFLNRWHQGKSVDLGYVRSNASIDTGPGVTANSEGLGEMHSEEWILTDTWENAFPFPRSSREQPPLTLPASINSIVPRGLPPINRSVFRTLLNF